jgi:hypothetical protein
VFAALWLLDNGYFGGFFFGVWFSAVEVFEFAPNKFNSSIGLACFVVLCMMCCVMCGLVLDNRRPGHFWGLATLVVSRWAVRRIWL